MNPKSVFHCIPHASISLQFWISAAAEKHEGPGSLQQEGAVRGGVCRLRCEGRIEVYWVNSGGIFQAGERQGKGPVAGGFEEPKGHQHK